MLEVELNRNEIFVKNLFNLRAISWASVITEPSILNWSGNNFVDLLVSFCTDLMCCRNNLASLCLVTAVVKWFLLAFLISDFVKFLYFLYSVQLRRFLFTSLFVRACAISALYHEGIRFVFTLLVLIGACLLRCFSNISYHVARFVSISDSMTEDRLKSSYRSVINDSSFRVLKHLYVVLMWHDFFTLLLIFLVCKTYRKMIAN